MAPRHEFLRHLILFVEPDGGWAVATGAGLQARGWSVAWAADTATAVPAARQTLPSLVVVDAALDNGAAHMLQQLRACTATALVPAIALVEDDGQQAAYVAAGVQRCLRKPIDVDELDAAAHAVLEADVQVHAPPQEVLADPHRLELLRTSRLLDSGPDAVFDAFTELAAALLPAQSARVTLVSDGEQVFKARTVRPGSDELPTRTPLSQSLCQWPVAAGEPLVVADARSDPLLAMNQAVTALGAVAYLGVPLLVDGHAIGTLCLVEDAPRDWDPDELALLEDLAAAVAAEVRLRLADNGIGERGATHAAEAVAALAAVLQRHGSALAEPGVSALAALLQRYSAQLAPAEA